jgi:uncharacterized protein YjiS (DUF1127 family)
MTIEAITARHHEAENTTVASMIFNAVRSAWNAAGKHIGRRRAERALREMDPRLLKDIGIDRNEIMSVVYTGSVERRQSHGHF